MKLSIVATAISSLLSQSSTPTAPQSSRDFSNDLTFDTEPQRRIDLSKHLSHVIDSSPLLSFHRALVEIPSISHSELAVAEFLRSYLQQHNFTVITEEVAQPSDSHSNKTRWNILAHPKGSSDDQLTTSSHTPKVLLTSHIDTVPPFIPYTLSFPSSDSSFLSSSLLDHHRRNIRISGRGTVDAKSCVAAQTHALLSLLATDTVSPDDVSLLFVVGEERSGDGMHTFSSSRLNHHGHAPYTAVIFGEPTESHLATGHKGMLGFSLHAHGKAAHSGYPWLGRSANSLLVSALSILDTLATQGHLPSSEKYGNSTLNIGRIEGGVAANVIPEFASAEIAIRLAGGTPSQGQSIIETTLKQHHLSEHLTINYKGEGYGPVNLDGNVPGFEEMTVNYGTDVPNLKVQNGVKRYLYGPGSILVAHGDNEGIKVRELEDAVLGYQRLVLHALAR